MKFIYIILGFIFSVAVSHGQTYVPVDKGSAIKFSIKNFGFNTVGEFKGIKGKIVFDPTAVSRCFFDVSVQAATIDTDNRGRDSHLRKEEYFDVEKYPAISYVSGKVSPSNKPGTLIIDGTITIKGVSHAVSFPFIATPAEEGYLFTGEFKINRRDFNVGGKSIVLSDFLTVSISLLAKKVM